MLDAGLLITLSGLALLDAVVTSTLYVVVAILLAARRPVSTSISYAIGQLGSFYLLTLVLYFGATFMAELLEVFTLWVRVVVLVGAAGFFIFLGVRRFKARPRHGIKLPAWVNPWTAFPFGIFLMIMDLPFAFPMFLAVERLVDLGIEASVATVTLAGYTLVSSLPTILLILVGITYGGRARDLLERLLRRFTTGFTNPSWKLAMVHFGLSATCLVLLVFMLDTV